MHTVTVWNRASTNFGANAFVKVNGTDTIQVESAVEAHRMIGAAMHDKGVDRAIIEGPNGVLTWNRHAQHQLCDNMGGPDDDEDKCDCDECDGGCDHGGGCDECDGGCDHGGGQGSDTEDFDINDPRR